MDSDLPGIGRFHVNIGQHRPRVRRDGVDRRRPCTSHGHSHLTCRDGQCRRGADCGNCASLARQGVVVVARQGPLTARAIHDGPAFAHGQRRNPQGCQQIRLISVDHSARILKRALQCQQGRGIHRRRGRVRLRIIRNGRSIQPVKSQSAPGGNGTGQIGRAGARLNHQRIAVIVQRHKRDIGHLGLDVVVYRVARDGHTDRDCHPSLTKSSSNRRRSGDCRDGAVVPCADRQLVCNDRPACDTGRQIGGNPVGDTNAASREADGHLSARNRDRACDGDSVDFRRVQRRHGDIAASHVNIRILDLCPNRRAAAHKVHALEQVAIAVVEQVQHRTLGPKRLVGVIERRQSGRCRNVALAQIGIECAGGLVIDHITAGHGRIARNAKFVGELWPFAGRQRFRPDVFIGLARTSADGNIDDIAGNDLLGRICARNKGRVDGTLRTLSIADLVFRDGHTDRGANPGLPGRDRNRCCDHRAADLCIGLGFDRQVARAAGDVRADNLGHKAAATNAVAREGSRASNRNASLAEPCRQCRRHDGGVDHRSVLGQQIDHAPIGLCASRTITGGDAGQEDTPRHVSHGRARGAANTVFRNACTKGNGDALLAHGHGQRRRTDKGPDTAAVHRSDGKAFSLNRVLIGNLSARTGDCRAGFDEDIVQANRARTRDRDASLTTSNSGSTCDHRDKRLCAIVGIYDHALTDRLASDAHITDRQERRICDISRDCKGITIGTNIVQPNRCANRHTNASLAKAKCCCCCNDDGVDARFARRPHGHIASLDQHGIVDQCRGTAPNGVSHAHTRAGNGKRGTAADRDAQRCRRTDGDDGVLTHAKLAVRFQADCKRTRPIINEHPAFAGLGLGQAHAIVVDAVFSVRLLVDHPTMAGLISNAEGVEWVSASRVHHLRNAQFTREIDPSIPEHAAQTGRDIGDVHDRLRPCLIFFRRVGDGGTVFQ